MVHILFKLAAAESIPICNFEHVGEVQECVGCDLRIQAIFVEISFITLVILLATQRSSVNKQLVVSINKVLHL